MQDQSANLKISVRMAEKKGIVNREQFGDWAIIAGAAGGIGAAFSELLAQRGFNLVMIDHQPQLLIPVAQELRSHYGIKTIEGELNLEGGDAWSEVIALLDGIDCRLMVYVPAYSPVKPFHQNSLGELDRYIDLNARTPLKLVHAFSQQVPQGKTAGIILMSSLAGVVGAMHEAPYSATKAFNILLSEALYHELKAKGISILTSCAGMTDTPTFWSAKPVIRGNWPGVMSPYEVAEHALKNLGRKPVCIPGWKNRFSYFILTQCMPRTWATRMVGSSMVKIFPETSSSINP